MLHLLVAAAIAAAPVATPAASAADPLHCRAAAGAARRCTVAIPAGRSVRPCAEGARCDRSKRYVAWVVESGGARCRISKKRTDWTRSVVATMSKKSAKQRGAACDLYVELL